MFVSTSKRYLMSAAMFDLVHPSGERHGIINRVANSVSEADGFKNMNPKTKAKCEAQKKEDHKLVKARYLNSRGNHERLTKPYMRWAGDPIDTYHCIPGEVYEVPMGLINEINGSPGLAKRSDIVDYRGVPTKVDGKSEKIHEFVPISF